MGNRLLVARDEISGRVARYDYDEVDNLISAEYERGGEVERLYRVSDRMGNLFETRERDDRRYDAGGRVGRRPRTFLPLRLRGQPRIQGVQGNGVARRHCRPY